jgi:hypothetical protein
MRGVIVAFFLMITKLCFAQKQSLNFFYIDRKVQSIEACAPDSLAGKLTSSYVTDAEKIRSIFRWITENIAYRTKNYPGSRKGKYLIVEELEDTLSASLNERIAIEVLRKKEAVCDGYARLFKTLCDYAGIRSEIITGYARANMNRVGEQFKSNHRWNAVLVDSNWYLLDATWASGYITYSSDQFVKAYDDYYFMTAPEDFIRDHYPEDSRWTLLTNPPTLREFYRTPFRHSAFAKYSISSFAPMKGIIEAAIGDTVNVELMMAGIDRREIAPDTLKEDIAILPQTHSSDFLSPIIGNDRSKISYRYPISSNNVEWLNIMYNDDIILRYKLNIRKNKDD